MTGEHLDEQSVVQINLVRQTINAMKTSKQPLHMWLEGTDMVGLAKASQICSGCTACHCLEYTSWLTSWLKQVSVITEIVE